MGSVEATAPVVGMTRTSPSAPQPTPDRCVWLKPSMRVLSWS